jgi:transcriptional regulator with XRE-family HTH domain
MEDAERVRTLRERTGLSSDEVAARVGLTRMGYFDLEFHDDELSTVPSLAEIKRLAEVFDVPTAALFTDDPAALPQRRLSYPELVDRVNATIAASGQKDALEDQIGWYLDGFLESEARALDEYPVEFLQALCDRLGVNWIEALP